MKAMLKLLLLALLMFFGTSQIDAQVFETNDFKNSDCQTQSQNVTIVVTQADFDNYDYQEQIDNFNKSQILYNLEDSTSPTGFSNSNSVLEQINKSKSDTESSTYNLYANTLTTVTNSPQSNYYDSSYNSGYNANTVALNILNQLE